MSNTWELSYLFLLPHAISNGKFQQSVSINLIHIAYWRTKYQEIDNKICLQYKWKFRFCHFFFSIVLTKKRKKKIKRDSSHANFIYDAPIMCVYTHINMACAYRTSEVPKWIQLRDPSPCLYTPTTTNLSRLSIRIVD